MLRLSLLCLIACLLLPAVAPAAVRYTTPGGTGDCSVPSPCSLDAALAGAAAGDEIRLSAEEYSVPGSLTISQPNLTIAGPPGRYAPADFQAFLLFSTSDDFARISVQAENLTLKRLNIVGSSGAGILINAVQAKGLTLERVRVTDNNSVASVAGQNVTLINSIVDQRAGSFAVEATGSIIGSTIRSAAVAISNNDSYHDPLLPRLDRCDLRIANTLALGEVRNLQAIDGGSACDPLIYFDYSWIASSGILDAGAFLSTGTHNLPDAPSPLTPGAFAPALGSPAINAGCDCGTEDFYGRPRPIGSADDLGAIEAILPPTAGAPVVSDITDTTARLTAGIGANGDTTTYSLQIRKAGSETWGTVAANTLTGDSVTAEANLLEPSSDYQVRATALNSAGDATSSVVDFRTTAAPQPPTPTVALPGLRARVSRNQIVVLSRVTVNTGGQLQQTISSGKRRWCRISQPVASLTVNLRCTLSRAARAALRKRKLRLTIKTTLVPSGAPAVSVTKSLKLRRRR